MAATDTAKTGTTGRKRSYRNLALAERVLDVLECANKLSVITVRAVAEECDIPASSVVRILETLCAQGYLVQLSRRAGYALTSQVLALSSGYHGRSLVVETLKPHVEELTRQNQTLQTQLDTLLVQNKRLQDDFVRLKRDFGKIETLSQKLSGVSAKIMTTMGEIDVEL